MYNNHMVTYPYCHTEKCHARKQDKLFVSIITFCIKSLKIVTVSFIQVRQKCTRDQPLHCKNGTPEYT